MGKYVMLHKQPPATLCASFIENFSSPSEREMKKKAHRIDDDDDEEKLPT